MKAPALTLIALALALIGCEANENGAPQLISQPAPALPTEEPALPVPPPAAGPAKAIMSTWTRQDGRFSVNLAALTDADASAGIQAAGITQFVVSPTVSCPSEVILSGTESSGTLNVVRSNSPSSSANDRYCSALAGVHDYAAMSGNQLRTCKAGVCYFWN